MKTQTRNFYAYNGNAELGHEPCGTEGRHIWQDLKTLRGAIKRMEALGYKSFRIYTFWNFFDNKTFKLVYKQD
jgi:hypothetical protein